VFEPNLPGETDPIEITTRFCVIIIIIIQRLLKTTNNVKQLVRRKYIMFWIPDTKQNDTRSRDLLFNPLFDFGWRRSLY